MSNSRNFSISINLCMWFHDHRQRAKIFINDDIQTVRDLEKRIEKIFKIKNFFLTSGSEFLPSSEDVRILQQNDVVWVMPNTCSQDSPPKTTPVVTSTTYNIETKKRSASVIEQDIDPPKKKKKKKHVLEDDFKYINPSKESKKKKKHIVDEINTVESQVDVIMDMEQPVVKNKKMKKKTLSNSTDSTSDTPQERSHSQNKSNSMNINQLLPVLQNHIESYNKKKILRTHETATTPASSETSFGSPLVLQNNSQIGLYKDTKEPYKCKGTLSSYKKKLSIPTITDKYLQEKKVNIVKIEYLSGKKSDSKKTEPSKCNDTVDRENGENSTYIDNTKVADTTTTLNLTGKQKTCSSNGNSKDQMVRNTMELEEPAKISMEEEECFENPNITAPVNSSKTNYTSVAGDNIIKSVDIPQMSNKTLNNTTTEKGIKNTNSIKLACWQSSPFVHDLSLLGNLKTTKPDNDDPKNSESSSNTFENVNTAEKSIEINKEKNICESIPCGTKPESSNGCSQTNSSAKVIEGVMNSAIKKYETDISRAPLNQTLENNVSNVVDCTVNEDLENFTEELQRNDDVLPMPHVEELKVSSLAAETDTLKENVSLVYKKETTNNASVNEEMINSSDSSKDSEIDLTKDEESLDKSRTNNGNSSIFSKRKHISGIGQLLGELRNNESLVTGESMDSDYSEFITKRKRKRVRKRKKKNKEANGNTSLNDSSILISPEREPKPVKSRACPTMHLKFEEDEDLLRVVDVAQKEVQTGQEKESYGEIPNITIDSDVEESNFVNFSIKEEYILKSPSIKNLLPKVGDIIAFKILRITENYTPDVSPYIIGKVVEYKTENKAVLYDILHGMEYCQEPKGILYIEEAQENTKCNRREYPWTDMIDPRLLFP